jgi:hypothetical protein
MSKRTRPSTPLGFNTDAKHPHMNDCRKLIFNVKKQNPIAVLRHSLAKFKKAERFMGRKLHPNPALRPFAKLRR